ncbi:hypothetical protein [Actinoplanes sp. NPDC051851]|uniref:hypothetical protein n=1 Tax=Actinoplanes sp. NPDC051851 TaxID=3154753 RepID=UPI003414B6A1
MESDEPFANETGANTAAWPGDGPAVEADLDGMRGYAGLMRGAQRDLAGRGTHLSDLHDLPVTAWEGDVLGEAAVLRDRITANASEFTTYLDNLGRSLLNIGCAAQTIADMYESGDAAAAASLTDVLFAYGDTSVPRPDGLPAGVGRTYLEALAEGDTRVTGDLIGDPDDPRANG